MVKNINESGENKNFKLRYEYNYRDDMREMIDKFSRIKRYIFSAKIKGEKVPPSYLNEIAAYLNNLLKQWDDYSNDLQAVMKKCKPVRCYTLLFDDVKDFVYGSFDYKSICKFTEALMIKCKNHEFNDIDTVDDFMDATVKKAFGDRASDVADLMDSVKRNSISFRYGTVEGPDKNKLTTLANKSDLFNSRDRVELYKAIYFVINWAADYNKNILPYIPFNDQKTYIAALSSIIEYAKMSVGVFITRIYTISAFASGFINNQESGEMPVSESVEDSNIFNFSDEVDGSYCNVMNSADEAKFKDLNNFKYVTDVMVKFNDTIGTGESIKPTFFDYRPNRDNTFSSELIKNGNELYDLIRNDRPTSDMYDRTKEPRGLLALNGLFKDALINTMQGVDGTYTSKQEMFHIIRSIKCDGTTNGYKELAKNLIFFSAMIMIDVRRLINNIIAYMEEELASPKTSLNTHNNINETIRLLTDFYSELALVILQKGRDIETGYNRASAKHRKEIEDMFTIKIPGGLADAKGVASDKGTYKGTTNDMSIAVPDTARIPISMINDYALPAFESAEMYDEYLRTMDIFQDSEYLSEAFSISKLINAIIAAISGVFRRWDTFVNNAKVKSAVKWVTEHEADIKSKDYSPLSYDILPYKINVGFDNGLKVLDTTLLANLDKFNMDNVKDMQAVDAYIKSLYPSENIYNWFNNSNGPVKGDFEQAKTMLRNHILYYKENESKVEAPKAVKMTGDELDKKVDEWVDTIKGFEAINKYLTELNTRLRKIQDSIKTKVSSYKFESVDYMREDGEQQQNTNNNSNANNNTSSNNTQSNNNQTAVQTQNADKDNNSGATTTNPSGNNNDKKEDNKMGDQQNIANAVLNGIQRAINGVMDTTVAACISYIQTEYSYIQKAYTDIQNNKQNNQNQNQNSNQNQNNDQNNNNQ